MNENEIAEITMHEFAQTVFNGLLENMAFDELTTRERTLFMKSLGHLATEYANDELKF